MTQEDRNLLLRDLCARLPYGVIIDSKTYNEANYRRHYLQRLLTIRAVRESVVCVDVDDYPDPKCREYALEHCKPYLRPMSSMTKEEVKELVKVEIGKYGLSSNYHNIISIDRISMQQDRHSWSAWLHYKTESGYYRQTCFIVGWVNWETTLSEIDWLNSHHFDYRGLIEKGLALEAPEDMYKEL